MFRLGDNYEEKNNDMLFFCINGVDGSTSGLIVKSSFRATTVDDFCC